MSNSNSSSQKMKDRTSEQGAAEEAKAVDPQDIHEELPHGCLGE